MARPGRQERNRTARSFRQLTRFHHGINSDELFGTHRALEANWRPLLNRTIVGHEQEGASCPLSDLGRRCSSPSIHSPRSLERGQAPLVRGSAPPRRCFESSLLGGSYGALPSFRRDVDAFSSDRVKSLLNSSSSVRLALGVQGRRTRLTARGISGERDADQERLHRELATSFLTRFPFNGCAKSHPVLSIELLQLHLLDRIVVGRRRVQSHVRKQHVEMNPAQRLGLLHDVGARQVILAPPEDFDQRLSGIVSVDQ
jgi:hypothetical protein